MIDKIEVPRHVRNLKLRKHNKYLRNCTVSTLEQMQVQKGRGPGLRGVNVLRGHAMLERDVRNSKLRKHNKFRGDCMVSTLAQMQVQNGRGPGARSVSVLCCYSTSVANVIWKPSQLNKTSVKRSFVGMPHSGADPDFWVRGGEIRWGVLAPPRSPVRSMAEPWWENRGRSPQEAHGI